MHSQVLVQPVDQSVRFVVLARCDPQSIPKVESVFRDEMSKLLKKGVSTEEVVSARNAFVEPWQGGWCGIRIWPGLLNIDARLASTRAREGERWRRTAALSPEEITGVARQLLDLSSFSCFKAGRF